MCSACQLHGRIVYSDESKSEQLWSQSEANEEIERAKAAGLLISAEISELRRQVDDLLPPQEVAEGLAIAVTAMASASVNEDETQSAGRSGRIPICDN